MSRSWKQRIATLSALACLVAATSSHAAIVWDWSFQGETGTFTTNGTASGNTAAAGTYQVQDFAVTSSAFGAPTGSILGGDYYSFLNAPDDFVWDGSAITQWHSVGPLPFLFFGDGSLMTSFLFGWDGLALNPAGAMVSNDYEGTFSYGALTVSVSGGGLNMVPEPATWATMLFGFGVVGTGLRRRRRLVCLA